jgi:hypothetical protein
VSKPGFGLQVATKSMRQAIQNIRQNRSLHVALPVFLIGTKIWWIFSVSDLKLFARERLGPIHRMFPPVSGNCVELGMNDRCIECFSGGSLNIELNPKIAGCSNPR